MYNNYTTSLRGDSPFPVQKADRTMASSKNHGSKVDINLRVSASLTFLHILVKLPIGHPL